MVELYMYSVVCALCDEYVGSKISHGEYEPDNLPTEVDTPICDTYAWMNRCRMLTAREDETNIYAQLEEILKETTDSSLKKDMQ